MITRTGLVVVGLALATLAGGCSHDARSSTATTAAPSTSLPVSTAGSSPAASPDTLAGTALLDPPTTSATTADVAPATAPSTNPAPPASRVPAATVGLTAPSPRTTTVRANTPPSTEGSRPTVPFASPGTTTTTTTPTKPTAPLALDRTCDGPRTGDQHFDLARISVQQQQSQYVFAAEYTGAPALHDVVVRFNLANSTYNVDGELFETGDGVAQLQDLVASNSSILPGQLVAAGQVKLAVSNDLLDRVAGRAFDVTVTLKVDGLLIETC